MVEKQYAAFNSSPLNDSDDTINLREILKQYLRYWPFFLVTTILTLTIAFFFYKHFKPAYEIKATILMTDDSINKSAKEKTALEELDLVKPPKLIQNEMEILSSRKLIAEVVDKLNLTTNYTLNNGLQKTDLYHISPVKINVFNPSLESSEKITIQLNSLETFEYINENREVKSYSFGDTIKSNFGFWRITPSKYIKSYLGKTITIVINNRETTIQDYQALLNLTLKDKLASIIELSITDKNPKRGKDFLNTLVYYYNLAKSNEEKNLTKSTIAFIDQRLQAIVRDLNNAEGKVEGYRSTEGLTDINSQSQVYLQNVQANDNKLNDINVQLNVLKSLNGYIYSADQGKRNTPSTIGISDPILIGLVQKLSELQLEKTKLLATLPERNPAFVSLNRQIAETKLALKENLKTIQLSLLASKRELESFKSKYNSSIANVPVQERQLLGLKRQQTIKENLYTYLLQKREEISLSYASTMIDVQLVDVAYVLPIKPSKKLMPFLIALAFGFLIPSGFLYGKDLARNRVTKRSELESATSIPVLGGVSLSKLSSNIIFEQGSKSKNFGLIEQLRNLRTQLISAVSKYGKGGKVILVTSSIKNEGKSFISTNLAISFVRSGKKTIILELDIYKPKITKELGLSPNAGISEYITGKANKEDIIQESPQYPGLSLISSGSFNENFSELLDQGYFELLIRDLKADYDIILLDTPPVHAIHDAYLLAPYSDVTLYVVRYNYTSKSFLPFIKKLFVDRSFPNMNLVLNSLPAGQDSDGNKYERYYN